MHADEGRDDEPSRRYASFAIDGGERVVVYDTTNHDAWVESSVSLDVRE